MIVPPGFSDSTLERREVPKRRRIASRRTAEQQRSEDLALEYWSLLLYVTNHVIYTYVQSGCDYLAFAGYLTFIIVICHTSLFLHFSIPTSPSTFTLCFTGFFIMKTRPHEPHPFYSCARLSPTFLWNTWTNGKWLPTTKEVIDLYLASEVMKILLVKDHTRKWKKSFHAKIIESTCATLAVGQFNWRRRKWWTKKSKSAVWPIFVSHCSCVFYVLWGS